MTSAIPVQRSNQLSYQANWELVNFDFLLYPVEGEMNVNTWNDHIFELQIKIELYEDHPSEHVSTQAVEKKKPEKIQTWMGSEPMISAIPVQRSNQLGYHHATIAQLDMEWAEL